MNNLANYLHQPGFARLWPLVRDRYIQLGRVGGAITLHRVSNMEREALSGLLARNLYGRQQIIVRLSTLDTVLRETRFEASLEDCLSLLYPDSLRTRQEERSAEEARWQQFCEWASGNVVSPRLREWIGWLLHGKGMGYRAFLECYEEYCQHESESPSWTAAVTALSQLPLRGTQRLPVFAAQVSGDAHGFDRDSLPGRILYYGIRAIVGGNGYDDASEGGVEDARDDTATQRDLYQQVGILLDDVSSIVLVAGWPCVSAKPMALPLRTVESMVPFLATTPYQVYVVENPSIFSALLDLNETNKTNLPHPIVCTSGQPSLAALRLLDEAVKRGAHIYYSGDLDVKGLQIALQLKHRYRDGLQLWRMDEESYRFGIHPSAPAFTEWEMSQLAKILGSSEPELYAHLLKHRRKVFQEHIVELLLQDYGGAAIS